MGFLDLFNRPTGLAIADCLARSVTRAESLPATLKGKAPDGISRALCRVYQKGNEFIIEALDESSLPLIGGQPLDRPRSLSPNQTYALALRGHLLAIEITREANPFDASFKDGGWDIESRTNPGSPAHISESAANRLELEQRFQPASDYLACPHGIDAQFPLATLLPLLNGQAPAPAAPPPPEPESGATRIEFYGDDAAVIEPMANAEESRQTCPICWKGFAQEEALNISSHPDLVGDPVLGSHAKLRFQPKRFNNLGQAIDEKGLVSLDLACPHCRGRLPNSFLSLPHQIISLVGAPSSGKSYFLATLLELLPVELMQRFGCLLQDGDPSGNVRLNEMKHRLFSALTPEDAFISKTDFEGLMYETLPRNGKFVALPRPFVYHLRAADDASKRAALVFYDNAGEHFKPTVNLDDSPGALHVAASAALLFLYDPTANRSFRKALRRKKDPQLRSHGTDEQETILAEMAARVKRLKAKDSHEQVDTPLAILVGKCDVWKSLLPGDALAFPADRPISPDEIDRNSAAVRALLVERCPMIVANAEALSRNVRYFPLSSLGHSPKEIETGPLAGRLAPVPNRLKPLLATAPLLWALAQSNPSLVAWPESGQR